MGPFCVTLNSIDYDDGCESWAAWTRLVKICQRAGRIPPETAWYVDTSVMMFGAVMHVNSAAAFDTQQARTVFAYYPNLCVSFHADDDPNIVYTKLCELHAIGIVNVSVWTMPGKHIQYTPVNY
jgi:hypothetical protein